MEEMLQYLNSVAQKKYSEEDNQKIADYLMGAASFESVSPVLKKTNTWGAERLLREIGQKSAEDNRLLPRVGRFVRILKAANHSGNFNYRIRYLCGGGLTYEDIYIGGGLGVREMLGDALDTLRGSYYYFTDLGHSSVGEFFENVCRKYAPELEIITEGERTSVSLLTGMLLYTRDPVKYQSYAEKIFAQGIDLVLMTGKLYAPLKEIKDEPGFENSRYIKSLESGGVFESGPLRKISGDGKAFARFCFYLAYALSPHNFDVTDTINYMLLCAKYMESIASCEEALRVLGKGRTEDLYNFLETLAKLRLIPRSRFFAYFSRQAVEKYDEPVYRDRLYSFALSDEKSALAAMKAMPEGGRIFLANAFWEKGMLLELVGGYEEAFIKMFIESNKIPDGMREQFEEWLSGRVEAGNFSQIALDKYYSRRVGALLIKRSGAAVRLFAFYILSGRTASFKNCLVNIKDFFGRDYAENFLAGLDVPKSALAAALAEAVLDEYNQKQKEWFIALFGMTASSDAGALEIAFGQTSAKARAFILREIYARNASYNPDFLVSALGDGSKTVRDLAVAYISARPALRPKVEALATAAKKSVRECAAKILLAFEGGASGVSGGEEFNLLVFCTNAVSANSLRSIKWTEFENLPKVRLAESETPADDKILQYYIYLFAAQPNIAIPAGAEKIRAALNKRDLGRFGEEVYAAWKKNGAPAKQRGILTLAAVDASDAFINVMKADIQTWADASRGAIASEAVRAMALNGGDLALMTVDAISKKFSNRQVKRAAEESFLFAAEQLGVEPEVLADRIVPNLGFDSHGELLIDYGSRKFTAVLSPDLQLSLRTADGKAIKALPAPNAGDDAETAKAARTDFAAVKKSLKSLVSLQCLRLEQALSSNRTWTKAEWLKLFVENPIMNMFAIGLIWGLYDEDGALTNSFRYMEDGTFNTSDENELEIPENAAIGLCHPLDLGAELCGIWKEQLSDYEIKPPIEQLERKVFVPKAENFDKYAIEDFGGAVVYLVSLWGKLQKLGWSRGSVLDGGGFYTFYKEDKKHGAGVQLAFSGSYIGAESTEEVTIYEAAFYKAGSINYGSYVYDTIDAKSRLKISEIPARLYSEFCYDIERAAAGKIRTDEDWAKKKN
ncbi:MAG: DUF4132 domain-containing protein [Oscillospiraceae bacterium]|jgi:hypothetical protein|nr:DUF4132 domain-containing protein [Oscillospiraceae bacterium]